MTIRPTKSLSTSNLQAVTIWLTNSDIRQHKWWLRPIQMVTIRQLYKKCSIRPAKRVHPTYLNDDHPTHPTIQKVCIRLICIQMMTILDLKKCASDLQMMTIRLIRDIQKVCILLIYICLLYKWWPSDLQMMTIRPTKSEHPTYNLVTIHELQNV